MSSLFMEVEEVMEKTGTRRAKAYSIIKQLNRKQLEKYPYSLTLTGKVNRKWFNTCMIEDITENIPQDMREFAEKREWLDRCHTEYEKEKKIKEGKKNA